MRFAGKIHFLGLAVICIGLLIMGAATAHDFVQKKSFKLGLYDRAALILGGILFLSGLLFLLLVRRLASNEKEFFSQKVSVLKGFLVAILVGCIAFAGGALFMHLIQARTKNDSPWSIAIYTTPTEEPLFFKGGIVSNPVLTREHVTDVSAKFVADPFLVLENDTYYMFFEVFNNLSGHGDISLATSEEGYSWTYSRIVLDESFHLSYPCVFKWKDDYFMIPETREKKSVLLYKAAEFPYRWTFQKVLLQGKNFTDSTIFQHVERWWLFSETGNYDTLSLFYADSPLGPWTEHPQSPVIRGDANHARPGGRVVVFDGRIIRYAQDDDPYYGNQVWAFEITSLTPGAYQEKKAGEVPVLKGFDRWNTRGMHHISPIRIKEGWIAAVDGF